MLEAYIIEQIRRKEQERLRRELETPPPLPPDQRPYLPPPPTTDGDSDSIIINYGDEPTRPDSITIDLAYEKSYHSLFCR